MSENQTGAKAVKAGIGYTLGNFMIRGIGFLTLFIFSRLMDTEQFGIYNGAVAVDSILYMFSGLALHSSVKSAHYTFPGETDRYVSSVSIIYVLNYFILTLLTFFFGNFFASLLNLPRNALYMMLLYSSGTALLSLYTYRISLDYAYKRYIVITLINTVANIGLSLVLMLTVFENSRAMGRIAGSSLSIGMIAVALLVIMWRKARPVAEKKYWRFGLHYSLPIIPHGLSQALLSQFDLIMIRRLDTDSHAGIYGLAVNLKIVLTVLSDSIGSVWETWFFAQIDQGNRKLIQKRSVQLMWLFGFFAVGMMMLAPEILLLGGRNFGEGKYVVLPMIVEGFILFLYAVIVPSEYYLKKTQYVMAGTMAAALINVITNYVFIKRYGYMAAAFTTLFSYVCYLVMHVLISRRLAGFHVIPLPDLLKGIGTVTLIALFNRLLIDQIALRYICNLAIVSAFALLLYRMALRDGINVISVLKGKLKNKQ